MIKLHTDCLVFETPAGENIPCSAESVSVELLGEAAAVIDPEIVRNAAHAVLHYFRVEQGRESVSVGEFMQALKTALSGVGLDINDMTPKILGADASPAPEPPAPSSAALVAETDLRTLATESGTTFELFFFSRLREIMGEQLSQSPSILRFTGLRSCVKQLTGSRRWCRRCQRLSDQIVTYLRTCLTNRPTGSACALVVV